MKKNKDFSDNIKALIIKLLKEGKSQKEVANILGVSKQRINYHAKAIRSGNKMTSKDHSRRKRKITDEMENFIMSKVNENRFSSGPELSILVGKEFDV